MSVPSSPPPPRRYTSPTGRILIPVLLVVLLIVVLGRPILISGLDLDDEEQPGPAATGPPDGGNKGPGLRRLAAAYPQRCLDADERPSGLGLVAASDGASIGAATPTGSAAFALQARPPIGFSASGNYLATAGADLWSARGGHVGIAFPRPAETWAWSPVADCIAGLQNGRLVVAEPDRKAVVLVKGAAVSTFAFSPRGDRIVFAVDDEAATSGLWLADLRTREVRRLQSSMGWVLVGWAREKRPILLRQRAGAPRPLSFPSADEVASCGDEIITIDKGRLASIGATASPSFVPSDRGVRYAAVACAPGANLMLVVRYEAGSPRDTTMAVVRRDGTLVREVGQQSDLEDAPMWGPQGTGVVFAGGVGGEGAAGPLVWFLPEGGTARPTGLRVDQLSDDLDGKLDWSATAPPGHPTN